MISKAALFFHNPHQNEIFWKSTVTFKKQYTDAKSPQQIKSSDM